MYSITADTGAAATVTDPTAAVHVLGEQLRSDLTDAPGRAVAWSIRTPDGLEYLGRVNANGLADRVDELITDHLARIQLGDHAAAVPAW